MLAGIDYGSKKAGTTVVCFGDKQALQLRQSSKNQDADQFIKELVESENLSKLFIDAPLSLPIIYSKETRSKTVPDFFYRKCDREVKAMSPMFLGGLTARAMKLKYELSLLKFYEAYPGGLARTLGLDNIDYKGQSSSIPTVMNKLVDIFNINVQSSVNNWHQVDAVLAYCIGLRFEDGKATAVGDFREGFIII